MIKFGVLPTADGSSDQVLKTNGSRVLSWTTVSGISVSGNSYATDLKIRWDVDNHIDFATTDNEINLHINGSEKMVILSDGKVGIGTTSHFTKLDVDVDLLVRCSASSSSSVEEISMGNHEIKLCNIGVAD